MTLWQCILATLVGLGISAGPALGAPPPSGHPSSSSEQTPSANQIAMERAFLQQVYPSFVQQSQKLAKASDQLAAALSAQCEGRGGLKASQTAWLQVHEHWVRLMAVESSPAREQYLLRRLDGRATVPELIIRGLRRAAAGERAVEMAGPASTGLGTIEWLLWSPAADLQGAPACPYLKQLGEHWVENTAKVHALLVARSKAKVSAEQVHAEYEEFVNQWFSGLERLRVHRMSRPLTLDPQGEFKKSFWPRVPSGQTLTDLHVRWQSLRQWAIGRPSLAEALRQKGAGQAAQRLEAEVRRCDQTMQILKGAAQFPDALACLGKLVDVFSSTVVPGLQVQMGFQDGDGG